MLDSSSHYESLFHAASVDLLIPEISRFPSQPSEDVESWWTEVERVKTRTIAFLDEKLFYLVALDLPDNVLTDLPWTPAFDVKDPPSELLRFLGRLQLTLTASFVPPLPPLESRGPPALQLTEISSDGASTPTGLSLAPPRTPYASSTPDGEAHLPPITPNPFPGMPEGEEQYAKAEGLVVWEGAVAEIDKTQGGRMEFRRDTGWEVVWRGEVPIAYVQTQVQNPLLSLTASVTLREQPGHVRTHCKGGLSLDAASIRSGTETVRTDGTEYDGHDDSEEDDLAGMEVIDLLGGLAGGDETMSATRLAPSIRQDLSLVQPSPTSSAPRTAVTLTSALSLVTPSTAGPSRERSHLPSSFLPPAALTTLRKSYRRVLSLSSGLRVRMRTLFLPQLLPVRDPDESPSLGESGGADGERRIVLCVEIENPSEGVQIDGFEIGGVTVDVGGKGAKATAELVCQPEQKNGVFPLRLRPVEQYNLLYAVNISSSPDATGKGDEQRPIAITVIGRPYIGETYPTSTFHSRWNCTLDLSFYASLFAPPTAPPQVRNSLTKPITSPTAVVAGDKRYSLASLNSDRSNPHRGPLRPVVSSGVNGRVPSCRGPQQPISDPSSGLLVSVKLLPPSPEGRSTVRVLEPFSVEVFVHNRTDEVRRFKLSLPGRDGGAGKVREASQKRRRRRADEPAWGADDPVLRQMLLHHLSSAPALVPLENDLRCGPLLPGGSLSSRIRFLALREGVHKLEKLRITGQGDDFDFVMSPVLDVVVGQGVGDR